MRSMVGGAFAHPRTSHPCRNRPSYAETQEQLGGFYIIDVPDLDQAIDWASRCPAAQFGTIEVRPIWPTGRQ